MHIMVYVRIALNIFILNIFRFIEFEVYTKRDRHNPKTRPLIIDQERQTPLNLPSNCVGFFASSTGKLALLVLFGSEADDNGTVQLNINKHTHMHLI